jgi:hypothetical protein
MDYQIELIKFLNRLIMKGKIIQLLLLLISGHLMAQNHSVNFGNIQIHGGVNLTFFGNYTNNGPFTANAGTVTFTGSSAQTLSGTVVTRFNNLVINNSSDTGVIFTGANVTVWDSLILNDGFVHTSMVSLLTIMDNATVVGVSDTNYIIGPMQKTGNDAFTFPIGKTGYYMPITITAPDAATDAFTAEYFRSDPKDVYGTAKDTSLIKVTDNEYWVLEQNSGTTTEDITLHWNGNTSDIVNPTELSVASWDGSHWDDLGNGGTTGTSSKGSIKTGTATANYTAFTLATTTVNNPIPSTLLYFKAVKNGLQVDLSWATASEINNDFFTIERTADGLDFQFVAEVDGAGLSVQELFYDVPDLNPMQGISYYRLKQTDFDGTSSYSRLAMISFEKPVDNMIYPNPFSLSINVLLDDITLSGITNLKVFNTLGEEVMFVNLSGQLTVLETSHLPVGIYFYQIMKNNVVVKTGKLRSQ